MYDEYELLSQSILLDYNYHNIHNNEIITLENHIRYNRYIQYLNLSKYPNIYVLLHHVIQLRNNYTNNSNKWLYLHKKYCLMQIIQYSIEIDYYLYYQLIHDNI
jgi:hypothetical protein